MAQVHSKWQLQKYAHKESHPTKKVLTLEKTTHTHIYLIYKIQAIFQNLNLKALVCVCVHHLEIPPDLHCSRHTHCR